MLVNRGIYRYNLPSRAIAVYLYLCDRADCHGICFPAVTTIARELSVSKSTVFRAISDLEKHGLLRRKDV